jgi:hypothetical protein
MVYQEDGPYGFTWKNSDVSRKTRMVDKKIGDSSTLDTDSYIGGFAGVCSVKKNVGFATPCFF